MDWEMIKNVYTIDDLCEISELADMIGKDEAYINRMLYYPDNYKFTCPTPVTVIERRKIFLRKDCIEFSKYYNKNN